MPRRPATVTQATVARVLRAVKSSGLRATVEVRQDGTILIKTSEEPTGRRLEPRRELML